MTLEQLRRTEIERYHRPAYFGIMREWRVSILRDWLTGIGASNSTYLDVGCGMGEAVDLASGLGMTARGCEVIPEICERDDVDLIPGAHALPYADDEFAVTSCNDVLEHILEDDVPAVLAEMKRVTRGAVLLGICRKPGQWHPTIKSEDWWLEKITANMGETSSVLYADRIPRIKQPYLWVEILCE